MPEVVAEAMYENGDAVNVLPFGLVASSQRIPLWTTGPPSMALHHTLFQLLLHLPGFPLRVLSLLHKGTSKAVWKSRFFLKRNVVHVHRRHNFVFLINLVTSWVTPTSVLVQVPG